MAKTEKSYNQLKAELDKVLAWFESDNVDLDLALAKYQQGTDLLEQLQQHLKQAENKIIKLNKTTK